MVEVKDYCPKTMSGKHLWGEAFNGLGKLIRNKEKEVVGAEVKTRIECIACGMIDDREEKLK